MAETRVSTNCVKSCAERISKRINKHEWMWGDFVTGGGGGDFWRLCNVNCDDRGQHPAVTLVSKTASYHFDEWCARRWPLANSSNSAEGVKYDGMIERFLAVSMASDTRSLSTPSLLVIAHHQAPIHLLNHLTPPHLCRVV